MTHLGAVCGVDRGVVSRHADGRACTIAVGIIQRGSGQAAHFKKDLKIKKILKLRAYLGKEAKASD